MSGMHLIVREQVYGGVGRVLLCELLLNTFDDRIRDECCAVDLKHRSYEVATRDSQFPNDAAQARQDCWVDVAHGSVRKLLQNVQQPITGLLLLSICTGSGETDEYQRVRQALDLTCYHIGRETILKLQLDPNSLREIGV